MEIYYVKRIHIVHEKNLIDNVLRENDRVQVLLVSMTTKFSCVRSYDCYEHPEWRLVESGDVVLCEEKTLAPKHHVFTPLVEVSDVVLCEEKTLAPKHHVFTPLYFSHHSQQWRDILQFLKKNSVEETPKGYCTAIHRLLAHRELEITRLVFADEEVHYVEDGREIHKQHSYCYAVLDHCVSVKIDTYYAPQWGLVKKHDKVEWADGVNGKVYNPVFYGDD